jgi:hypothetical protein
VITDIRPPSATRTATDVVFDDPSRGLDIRRRRGSTHPRWQMWGLGGGLAALTAIIRLIGLGAANQITVDEIFYMNLGNSVRHGHIPPTLPPGEGNVHQVFLLHPPGFFMLEALWEIVAGRPAGLVAQVIRTRELNTVVAAITVVLIFALVRRLAGPGAGLAAGLLFSIDPFVIRENGLVFLETSTMMWVLAGMLLLVRVAQGSARRPALEAGCGGLLLGLAVLTKDLVAVETVAVLTALAALGWVMARRLTLWALVISVVPYSVYLVACVAQGYGGALVSAKTSGIRRALGITISTGFNRQGSPSLAGNLTSQAGTFAFSYLIVGVGTVCGLWLLRSRRPEHRLLGMVTAGAVVLVGYSLVFGTIEEQFLYYLSIPAIIASAVVLPSAVRRVLGPAPWRRPTVAGSHFRRVQERPTVRRRATAVVASLMAVTLIWNGIAWIDTQSHSVDEMQQLTSWMQAHVPSGSSIAYAEGVIQFALEYQGFRAVPLGFPRNMAADGVRYLVAIPKEVEGNYAFVSPQSYQYFLDNGRTVYQTSSSGFAGNIVVTEPDNSAAW